MKLLISVSWAWKSYKRSSMPCLAFGRSIAGFGLSLIFSEDVLLVRLSLDSYLILFFEASYFLSFRLTSALFFRWISLLFCMNYAYDRMLFKDFPFISCSLLTLRLMLRFSFSASLFSLFLCLLPNLCLSPLMPAYPLPLLCE